MCYLFYIDDIYHSEAKREITAFHAYVTLHARKNRRYRLAVRYFKDSDIVISVLAEFLAVINDPETNVKAVYRFGFYDNNCIMLFQAHNHAYVIPGERRFRKNSQKDGVVSVATLSRR